MDKFLPLVRDLVFVKDGADRAFNADSLAERYFAGRTDGLRPPSNVEERLVATTYLK